MKPIEFVTTDVTPAEQSSPWIQPKKPSFQDLILKPEYEDRKLRLPIGESWLRILPAFQASPFGWLLVTHALNYEGGRIAHPKTLHPNSKSAFDHAYTWIKAHFPERLYSKENKAGIRLLTDPMCLFWVLLKEEGKTVARLFQASGYDGSRGGVPGLGYKIWLLTREVDEMGEPMPSMTDPKIGVMLRIEKTQAKESKYPNYTLRRGSVPTSIDDMITTISEEEFESLCPIEQVVRELSEEEQWKCLEKVIDKSWVKQIRDSLKR